MKFFEDIRVGETAEIGRHTFEAEEIKAFAARFDPQPFHLDEVAAERSHFGRLCASGWHTISAWGEGASAASVVGAALGCGPSGTAGCEQPTQ